MFNPDKDPYFLPITEPGSRGKKGTGSRIRICNTAFSASYLGTGVDHELQVVVRELLDKALGQAAGVDGVGGGVERRLVAAVQLGPEAGQLGARAVAFLQLVQQLTRCVGTLQSHPLCRALFPNQSRQRGFLTWLRILTLIWILLDKFGKSYVNEFQQRRQHKRLRM